MIRRLKMSEIKVLAEFALNSDSSKDILARSQELAQKAAPGIFETQI